MTVTCPLCRQPDVLVEDRTSPPTLTKHYLAVDAELAIRCPASFAELERVDDEARVK